MNVNLPVWSMIGGISTGPEEEILTSVLHDGEDTLANSFTSSVVFGHVPEESIRDFVEEENLSGSPGVCVSCVATEIENPVSLFGSPRRFVGVAGNDIVGLTSILSSKIDSFLSKIRVEIQDFSLSVCTTNPSLPVSTSPWCCWLPTLLAVHEWQNISVCHVQGSFSGDMLLLFCLLPYFGCRECHCCGF